MKLEEIPQNSRFIIENYLIPGSHGNAKMSSLLLNLYMHISRVLCFNRIKIQRSELESEFPMLYGMYFGASGAYKDRPQEILDDISYRIFDEQKKRKQERYDKMQADMLEKAELEKTPSAKAEYKKRHEVRWFKEIMNGGTYQGLQTDRMACYKYGFGHIHFKHSEIIDTLKGRDPQIMGILSKAKEMYNKGDSFSDTIKGEQINSHVEGVPFTMMLHGSIAELHQNESLFERLHGLLNTGFAKRSFIIFSKSTKRKILTYSEEKENLKKMSESRTKCGDILYDVYKNTSFYIAPGKASGAESFFKTMDVNEDVRELAHCYKMTCTEKANEMKDQAKQYDLYDRSWRAFRLAACIAAIEHPEKLCVTAADYDFAIKLTEMWGKEFFSFLGNGGESDCEKLFNFILDSGEVSKTELRNTLPRNVRTNSKFFEDSIDQLRDMCADEGKILVEHKGARGKTSYSIQDEPKHNLVDVTSEDDIMVKYAEGKTFELNDTDYENKTIGFKDFWKVARDGTRYTTCHFIGGQRCNSAYMQGHNLIIMDFDNDWSGNFTVEDAKEKFKDFVCMITTTTHHRIKKRSKTKEKPVKDRFRVILPTNDFSFSSLADFKNIMENICNEFDINGALDLGAMQNLQLPYASNRNAEHWYSNGLKILNWKVYDYQLPSKKQFKNASRNVASTDKPNVMNPIEIKTKHGSFGWDHFENIHGDMTAPCFCPFGTHEDSNPSAFVARHENGSLYVSCKACNETKFNK